MRFFENTKATTIVYVASAVMMIAVASTVIFGFTRAEKTISPTKVEMTSEPLVPTTETARDYMYIIKEREGKVAVEDSAGKFFYNLDVMIDSLPIYDQQAIKDGIKVENENDLKSLIEDLTS